MGVGTADPTPGFGRLIAPASGEAFFSRHWDREPLALRRGTPDFYADLLDLEAVDRELACDPRRLSWVDAGRGERRRTAHLDADGSVFVEQAFEELARGGSVVLDGLERRIPGLGRCCRLLERELSYRVRANAYLTAAGGSGFPPHYDSTNTLILQIHGTKAWRLGRRRAALPEPGDRPEPSLCVGAADDRTMALAPGDALYIPRGVVHSAAAGETGSLHVTLSLEAPSWTAIAALLPVPERASGGRLSDLLPPGFLRHDSRDLAAELLRRLPDRGELAAAVQAVERFTQHRARAHRAGLEGRLIEALRGGPIDAEQRFAPRAGLVYRVRSDGAELELTSGPLALRFDARLGAAVDFCLETARYRARDLPDPPGLAEKVDVVSNLLEAGLVVRAPAG